MKKTKMIIALLLTLVSMVPVNVSASSNDFENRLVDISKQSKDAVLSVDMTEANVKETRMGSITAGKTQVMAISVSNLRENQYINTFGDKKLPAKNQEYWVTCTAQKSGTEAKVGLVYYNYKGELKLESSCTLYGYDSYGRIYSNAVYENFGYVENIGTGKLEAAYVILKEKE